MIFENTYLTTFVNQDGWRVVARSIETNEIVHFFPLDIPMAAVRLALMKETAWIADNADRLHKL